ncbi:MAG: endopeptidase La [Bacteroidetes bacterium GWE2_29_8]|nr:MAG: endopeptidase La [Bacteroidetes bacterium GWE2_29_8]OFY17419.1 MAG: endopeptidase La [Bacteroidetes bacterium GWF2_29_10]
MSINDLIKYQMISDNINDDSDLIPLISLDEDDMFKVEDVPDILSLLPLRNTVLFPGVVIPITVTREKSIKLVKDAYKGNKIIGVVTQRNSQIEEPKPTDLFNVGTIAYIVKILQMPDSTTTVIIQGKKKFAIKDIVASKPYFKSTYTIYKQNKQKKDTKNFSALISSIKDIALKVVKNSPNIPPETAFAIKNIENSNFLINFISSNINIDILEKQNMLEIQDVEERALKVLEYLSKELQVIELKNEIQSKVKIDLDKQQRDYILHQQLKTIQEELGGLSYEQEINELKDRAKDKKWSEKIKELFNKEFAKLQRMNPSAAEYSVQMNYIETLLDLPWNEYTKDNYNLKNAKAILDQDHFGLEKVKERILEYLAVLKLKGDLKSPILCLVGPPGVGKTSLGKSIARALGRGYVRMSLGGVHDEAEIRGHRKTYIGAMPGRIMQNIKKSKSSNPVFVLDEVDKLGSSSVHGDPSSALLEVLDPEQNYSFNDNYLDVEYDLSRVMFVATANNPGLIQSALLDRMELIDISGYIIEEKVEIAKRHLIPKQISEHGLEKTQIFFNKNILEKMIQSYTRESGVRNLERLIAKIIRNTAKFIASNEKYNPKISLEDVERILGPERFLNEQSEKNNAVGVVTGLAWTSFGGDILFIEASQSKGKGILTVTGNLGDIMKESATLAYQYIKSNAETLGIDLNSLENTNIHIHVPEGATPKDGPSAGVTMFTSIVSVLTQKAVKSNFAMTGEITLRGKVLPVGGIKEKILAAKRSNITDIILPADNLKDVAEISEVYIAGLKFHYIKNMMEITKLIFAKK